MLALLGALCVAGSARASSLVFTKPDGNVWLANPDGSGQYQVTLDGSSATPYSSPTQADDGTVVAARGSGDGSQIYRMTQNGTLLNAPFSTAAPGGPLDPVVTRDGSLVSFWGISGTNPCYPFYCLGTASSLQVSYADHYVDPSTFNPSVSGWSSFERATWLSSSRQLLFANNGTLWYYDLHQSQPVQWYFWPFDSTTFGLGSWIEGAASRDGTRLALVAGEDGGTQNATGYTIQLFTTGGDLATGNPPSNPTPYCHILPPDGTNGTNGSYPGQYVYFDSLSWSPDGQSLAFEYKGAIYVANIGNLSPGYNCSQITVAKVIDPGSDPNWGPAAINPQQRGTGGNGGTSSGSQPPSATTGAANGVSKTAATLTGTVNPNGSTVTSCRFEYATTTAYGTSVPCAHAVGGGSTVPVSAALSGLAAATTYHYRLVAGNADGTTDGSDRTFTTRPKVPPPSCSRLRGTTLENCQAQQTYKNALAACDHTYHGKGKSAKAKNAACRKRATTAYRRMLALVKCSQVTNKHRRTACIRAAGRVR
jgi:hypothetical protein